MIAERALLTAAYAKFNARDLDGVLSLMHADVDWPNGWEGGRVCGREGVRDYWTRQWAVLDPRVEPIRFATDLDGHTIVTVHQVVRDLAGTVLSDDIVEHVYQIGDGLIVRMDIKAAGESDVSLPPMLLKFPDVERDD